MPKIIVILIQLSLFLALSPFFSGMISKVKNNIRMRQGQSIFQPYFNLAKFFNKDEVIAQTASWIFRVAPFVIFSSTLTAALLIPLFFTSGPMNYTADFLALIFILGLGRFFMALAGLDTGSSFTGMGSSREMFISSLAEPVLCLVVFSLGMQFGSTNIAAFNGPHTVSVSCVIAGIALFLAAIAETSRIPVDNQETHLELTMVHEAMVLEYSGKRLAFIEMSAYIKQMIWFSLIAQIVFPSILPDVFTFSAVGIWFLWYLAKMSLIALAVSLIEVSVAKMRLFRVADFLGFAFTLAVISSICAILGV
ncbi:MAG: NADH-quinone oxidoreductase subunit H [Candidatus Omnitrophica bacterium]|nr:NADH-quinone oxidoreductase subunit H [Candidatus Omnitrophota bacterium]